MPDTRCPVTEDPGISSHCFFLFLSVNDPACDGCDGSWMGGPDWLSFLCYVIVYK